MKNKHLTTFLSLALSVSLLPLSLIDRPLLAEESKEDSAFVFEGAEDDLAFKKFDHEVVIEVGMNVPATDKTLKSGESAENNKFTQYLKENFNIVPKLKWQASGENFIQKLSLAIGSDDLPDVVVAPDKSYLTKAYKSNSLYDLTDVFKQYASKQVMGIQNSTKGRALESASFDGRIMALPSVTTVSDGVHLVIVRKDWLDKLNLEAPKTVEDVEKIARAFIDNKMGGEQTIGIMGPSKDGGMYSTFLRSSSNPYGFDPIFTAMGAYPGYWLKQDDGSVVYGSTTEETKSALELLARWYKEGLIDPEVGTRDNASEVISANQCGLFFGPWWSCGYGLTDSIKNDPTADWHSYAIVDANKEWNPHMKAISNSYSLVSKRVTEEQAQAIVIMNNVLVRDEKDLIGDLAIEWWPARNIMANSDETEFLHNELLKVLKGETKPDDYKDTTYKTIQHDAQKALEIVNKDADLANLSMKDFTYNADNFGEFQRVYSMLIGNKPYSEDTVNNEVYSVIYEQTPKMERRWANLEKLEKETFLKILHGQSDISEFDNFVNQWKAESGDSILQEVQEYAK